MMNNLAMYRKKAGLRQIDLAKKIGVSNKTMNEIEKPDFDLRKLSLIKLGLICELLNIKISDLVGEVE